MRFGLVNSDRRPNADVTPDKARVIGGVDQRTIQPGRFNLKRIRIDDFLQSGVEASGQTLAEHRIDPAGPIDHQRQCRRTPLATRAVLNDLDVRELFFERQREHDTLKGFRRRQLRPPMQLKKRGLAALI